eukprot:m.166042 g.166042  ORF g.166042 m.166042 type:complete len:1061 (+) comp15270_c0_seq4:169-3351(+)
MPARKKAVAAAPKEVQLASCASVTLPFMNIQKPHSSYKKGITDLNKAYEKVDEEVFMNGLKLITNHCLLHFKREPAVERVVDLLVKFVAEHEQNNVINEFVSHLLQYHGAKEKSVRFRVCQIIGKLLAAMPDDAEIDEDVFAEVEKAGKLRMTDKIPAVRVQACTILTRLQDPNYDEDPITEIFIDSLASDISPEVRKCALAQLEPSERTLPTILQATRDAAATVRKEAFRCLQTKVEVEALSVSQRMKLVSEGLKERASDVKVECIKMICQGWYDASGSNKVDAAVEMLSLLDVQTEPDTCAAALKEVIPYVRDWNAKVSDFKTLTCERVFFWRVLAEYYKNHKLEDSLDSILPSIPDYAAIVHAWAEKCSDGSDLDSKLQNQFVTEQLLHLACSLDFSDEAGRNKMVSIVTDLLQRTLVPESVVERASSLAKLLCTDEKERLRMMTEIIAEIRQPIAVKKVSAETKKQERARALERSKITVKLTELRISLDELVRAEQFIEAGNVKEQIQELETRKQELSAPEEKEVVESQPEFKDDPETWTTCLRVAKALMKSTPLTMKEPALAGLVHSVIIPAVKNSDPEIRNNALAALGMACCMHDSPSMAQEHFPMFLVVLHLDQDAICNTVLQILFDFILQYGMAPFSNFVASEDGQFTIGHQQDEEEATPQRKKLIDLLDSYLESEDDFLRATAVQGMCKLLLLNHVTSPKMFSRLVLQYYSSNNEDNQKIMQCLSFFFPAYSFSSSAHASIVEEAFIPMLRKVVRAKKGSEYACIKPQTLAKFFVFHTSESEGAGKNKSKGDSFIHESLAIKVLNEILSAPRSAEAKTLLAVLSYFDVKTFSPLTTKSLHVLATSLAKVIKSVADSKKVADFLSKLKSDAVKNISTEHQDSVKEELSRYRKQRNAEIMESPPTSDYESADDEVEEVSEPEDIEEEADENSDVDEVPPKEEIAQEKEVEKDVEENEIIENASEDDILVDEPPKPKKKSETAKKVKQEKKPKKERTTRSRRKPETEVELENEVDELLASAEKPKMSSRRGTRTRKKVLQDLNDSVDELIDSLM